MGRNAWKCTERDREYVLRWVVRKYGKNESRRSLKELNTMLYQELPPSDLEALKSALRQYRRRAKASEDLFGGPRTVTVSAEAFDALQTLRLNNETYSDAILRLAK